VQRPVAAARQALGQAFGHAGGDELAPAVHGVHGLDQLVRVAVLVQETARAQAQQRGRVVRFGMAAEDEHRQRRRTRADGGQHIDAVLARHRDVEQDHVDLALAHDVQRLASVGRLGDHLQVGLLGEELAQTGAHHGVVVDDGDADHGGRQGQVHDSPFGERP